MAQLARSGPDAAVRILVWFVIMIPGSLWVINLTQLAWEWDFPCLNPRLTPSSIMVHGLIFLIAAGIGTAWTGGSWRP